MRETSFRVAAGTLFAIETGERGAGSILLLHGVTANAYVWQPVMGLLAGHHHVVAIDQRGHGRSSAPPGGPYDGAAYADDVAAVIEGLGGPPAVVVGHSLGARNAIVAGARHPRLVAGLVAIDFTPYVESEIFDALEARVGAGDTGFSDLDEVRAYLTSRYPGLPPDAVARRAEHGYGASSDGMLRPLADPGAVAATCTGLREELQSYLAEVAVPSLLVRGAESAFVSAAALEATCRLRPDLEAVVVEGADHYVPEEQPAAVAELVRRFSALLRPQKAKNHHNERNLHE